VLILRDVLGFSAREVAGQLDATPASVNSALQRARKSVRERLPSRSQQATLRSLGDERARAIVERYVDAWERGDIEALAAVLAEDATFAMPPYARWWRGRAVIAAFAASCLADRRPRWLSTRRVADQLLATASRRDLDPEQDFCEAAMRARG
jgi:SnoaL-like domain/Sigma-70, region 4